MTQTITHKWEYGLSGDLLLSEAVNQFGGNQQINWENICRILRGCQNMFLNLTPKNCEARYRELQNIPQVLNTCRKLRTEQLQNYLRNLAQISKKLLDEIEDITNGKLDDRLQQIIDFDDAIERYIDSFIFNKHLTVLDSIDDEQMNLVVKEVKTKLSEEIVHHVAISMEKAKRMLDSTKEKNQSVEISQKSDQVSNVSSTVEVVEKKTTVPEEKPIPPQDTKINDEKKIEPQTTTSVVKPTTQEEIVSDVNEKKRKREEISDETNKKQKIEQQPLTESKTVEESKPKEETKIEEPPKKEEETKEISSTEITKEEKLTTQEQKSSRPKEEGKIKRKKKSTDKVSLKLIKDISPFKRKTRSQSKTPEEIKLESESKPEESKTETEKSQTTEPPKITDDKQKKIQQLLLNTLNKVESLNEDDVVWFRKPVTKQEASDYDTIIFRRMDLSTIKDKIKANLIPSVIELWRHLLLMFQNAQMYNIPSAEVHQAAKRLRAKSRIIIEEAKKEEKAILQI